MLKAKAYEELETNMKDITDRKYLILEAIITLKDKVSKDVSKMRVSSALTSRSERAHWRKRQTNITNTVVK